MKKHPIWYLVIGIAVLVIPTGIYLGFLIPSMSTEYNILMASGGCVGGAGLYGASQIPDKVKYSGLFKLAANSFTILAVTTLVHDFIMQLVGLVIVFVVSFIIFNVLKECYRNGKQRKANSELAEEIARSIDKITK